MFQKEDEGRGTDQPAKVPPSAKRRAGPPAEAEEQEWPTLDHQGWLRPAGPSLTHRRMSCDHRCQLVKATESAVVVVMGG